MYFAANRIIFYWRSGNVKPFFASCFIESFAFHHSVVIIVNFPCTGTLPGHTQVLKGHQPHLLPVMYPFHPGSLGSQLITLQPLWTIKFMELLTVGGSLTPHQTLHPLCLRNPAAHHPLLWHKPGNYHNPLLKFLWTMSKKE